MLEEWKNKPAKLAQKDRDARWTIKYSKAKPKEDGVPQVDLASCLWSAGSAGISSFVPFPLLKWPPEYQTGGAVARDPRYSTPTRKTE
jgi:hypothetical protein